MLKFQEYDRPEIINGERHFTTEILNGTLFDRTEFSLRHQAAKALLSIRMQEILKPVKGQVFHGLGLRFDKDNFLIPDISVFGPNSKLVTEDAECAPELVIEITSPTTRRNDMLLKKEIYAGFGISEYWVIDLKAETIDLYALNPVSLTLELDSCYHYIRPDELNWDYMTVQEKAEVHTAIKSKILSCIEIPLQEIFEDM